MGPAKESRSSTARRPHAERTLPRFPVGVPCSAPSARPMGPINLVAARRCIPRRRTHAVLECLQARLGLAAEHRDHSPAAAPSFSCGALAVEMQMRRPGPRFTSFSPVITDGNGPVPSQSPAVGELSRRCRGRRWKDDPARPAWSWVVGARVAARRGLGGRLWRARGVACRSPSILAGLPGSGRARTGRSSWRAWRTEFFGSRSPQDAGSPSERPHVTLHLWWN